MRRDPGTHPDDPPTIADDELARLFDRPEVVVAYRFGSSAGDTSHPLSDIDLAYFATTAEAEEALFDPLYESLQRRLGEGAFDLVPLRRAPLHLQFAVATEGRRLLARDAALAERFEAGAIVRYLDFKPYRDAYFARGG